MPAFAVIAVLSGTRRSGRNVERARANEWREWIESGEIFNLEGLAERTGHDRKYAHAILELAFLAPDIQKAILTDISLER